MIDLNVIEVSSVLNEHGIVSPSLSFLSSSPGYIRILMLQPKAVIDADANGVRVMDHAEHQRQVDSFLNASVGLHAELVIAPEYCCPWESILRAVANGVVPDEGKLWALGCQSLTRQQFETYQSILSIGAEVIIELAVFDEPEAFVDPLVYLFRANRTDGSSTIVILIQPKTHAMGGGEPFEYTYLQTGSRIYRFVGPGDRPNALVGLVCSDVLHPQFAGKVHAFHHETLLLHIQLNPDSSPAPYRAYRTSCCGVEPRTSEILTLNWALGTQIQTDAGVVPFIEEPRTMLLRPIPDLDTTPDTASLNHSKGIYLSNWQPLRTAAFVFAPDAHMHYFLTTKPSVVGPATNARRTGPRALELFDWDIPSAKWQPRQTPADDRFISYWLTHYLELVSVLEPLSADPGRAERLISLCIGNALSKDWDVWTRMPAYELADDDTSCRLTTCWAQSGKGHDFRASALARFRGFVGITILPEHFSSRLAAFKSEPFKVDYSPVTAARRFQNLHLSSGVSATAIYLGQTPAVEVVERTITETIRWLQFFGGDAERVAIWSRDGAGALRDHMSERIPQITGDPNLDPADIASGA